MITKDEILTVAGETGLTPVVVEKDFVLGWLLAAIDANTELSSSWVFKGGTCLKKCYFETYRFSEDLDFTLQDGSQIDEEFLKSQFSFISEWLYEESGIAIPIDRLIFDIYENPREQISCEGRVYYQSYFAGGKRSYPKIKFDLTADEILVMPPSRQQVSHAYSDLPQDGIYIPCYSYPEIFGEKIRALGERGRPRDLYDVINLFRNNHLPANAVLRDVLSQKCAYKKIDPPILASIEGYKEELQQNWEPMLAHQLPSLPVLEAYWDTLPEFFDWLNGQVIQDQSSLSEITGSGSVYRPQYGQLGLRTQSGSSLEIIRFAAGNRLCVDLDYTDNNGNRKTRIIEPYSLRRAQNGNILLYAVRSQDGQIRAYKINQINDASITNQVYRPRYQIELNASTGVAPITQLGRTGERFGNIITSGNRLGVNRRVSRRASNSSSGPTYVYRCSACNKTFRRKKQNSKLNAHKTKDGWPCPGLVGYLEKML